VLAWQDLVRYALAWGLMAAVIYFWYWIFSRIGDF
jgi:hypothetical protein